MIFFILWVASWLLAAAMVMYGALTTRAIHPDFALLARAVITLLLIAGVIFMMLAG